MSRNRIEVTRNTRSLIIDSKNNFILPSVSDRITFDNKVDVVHDPTIQMKEYEMVQEAFKDNHGMHPLLARRHLGHHGTSAAYLLTPGVGKNPEPSENWHFARIENVTDHIHTHADSLDPFDLSIYTHFLTLKTKGEFGPFPLDRRFGERTHHTHL